MRASGESLTADEASRTASIRKAKAELYRDGRRAASVSADMIRADAEAGELTAAGAVKAESLLREAALSVAELTWNHRDHRITGRGGVRFESDVGSVSADAVTTDTAFQTVRLYSDRGGRAFLNATSWR